MTDVGIPWAWPFVNEDGKRWGHRWVLHPRMRFTTDHAGEVVAIWSISIVCTAVLVVMLMGPQLAVALHITPG